MKTIFFCSIFVMVILASLPSLAIGLSPAKKIIDFVPNEKQSIIFSIFNNEKKDFDALVSLKGELANYSKTKDFVVRVNAHEGSKELKFDLEMPESMEKPGVHEADIVVLELPKESSSKDDIPIVNAVPSIVGKIWVRVPFPHKYIESKLIIEEAKVSEYVKFTMPIFNYGKERIGKAFALLEIYDGQKKIAEVKTNEIAIETKGQGTLSASWKADVNPGIYRVVALITYNGIPLKLEQEFGVGSMQVDISKIDIGKFSLGGIAKFDIYLESRWNKAIGDVYGEMIITDKNGTIISKIKTASIDIKPLSDGKITAYWDTKGVNIGSYGANLAVYYNSKSAEKSFSVNVNIDSITTSLAPTAQAIGGKGFDKENILIMAVVILVLINVGWFVYFKKFRKLEKN